MLRAPSFYTQNPQFPCSVVEFRVAGEKTLILETTNKGRREENGKALKLLGV